MDRAGAFVVLWGAFGGDLVRLAAALWILLYGVSWSISHEAFAGYLFRAPSVDCE
jgi:hypothetical protein